MCGIAGWLDRYEDISQKAVTINKMSETLKDRGPDEDGVFLNKEYGVCLIHRRLVVIDKEGGAQPMTLSARGACYTIVYNGELYNTEQLRRELVLAGYSFESHSDTEVLLNAYINWGESCPEHLNGIFAFAVWDNFAHKLFVCRDRIGVKPFFYYQYKGGLIFGSEIKAILANPLYIPKIDEEGLNEIFFIGPGRTGGLGVFKDIYELLPGECGTYKNGILKKRRYFKVSANEHTDTLEQTIEKTRFLLKDSIERQLVSDVPLCTFLSGGLDSSIISACAADYYKNNGMGKLTTYSVDYEDNAKYFQKSLFQPTPDSDFISLISDFIGTDHKNIVLNNNDLYYALYGAVDGRDLPAMTDVDSSLLLFCREVKKDFTVALSGECADEIFGGYPWYHNESILFNDCFPWANSLDVRRGILKYGVLKNGEEYVRERYLKTVKETDKTGTESKLESRMKEMFMLNFDWFMQGLLDRKDRMSMLCGLEVRVPFCDYRLVEYAYNMPWSMKALNGREKGILRTIAADFLPEEIAWRKKSPYPKTHNPIYCELVSKAANEMLNDKKSVINRFISREGVEKIINDPDSISGPWYGQLMKAPQILAYLLQMDYWFKKYNPQIIGI